MKITNLKLNGLHCEACVKLSTMKLKKVSGVQDVTIDLSGHAEIVADRDISLNEFKEALKGTDYSINE